MKKFYNLIKKMATLSPKLSYSHYVELLSYNDMNKINYYIKITEEQNLSVRELRARIKNNEYERLDSKTKEKLKENKSNNEVTDYIKNPILINNKNNYNEISEKMLQKIIRITIMKYQKKCYKK